MTKFRAEFQCKGPNRSKNKSSENNKTKLTVKCTDITKILPAFSILSELATWNMNTLATSFSAGQYTNQAEVLQYSSGAQRPMGISNTA